MKNGKVLVIGLDGGTFSLIKPWMEEGELPTFKKIMDGGVHGELRSTIPHASFPAIPSFYTGKNPANHGVFRCIQPDGSAFRFDHIKSKAFWDILGENGKKVCIFNMPATYPPKKVNGILISNTLTSSKELDITFPKELKDEFDFPVRPKYETPRDLESKKKILAEIVETTSKRFDIMQELLKRDFDFPLFFVAGTDVAQHLVFKHKDLLLPYFREIDEGISGLMDGFENIIIFSDHGFEACPDYDFHINSWLQRENCQRMVGGRFIKNVYSLLRNLIPKKFVRRMKRTLKKAKSGKKGEKMHRFIPGIDWDNTMAYGDCGNGLRIIRKNLDGRDYEEFRDTLIEKLKGVEFNGREVMKEVLKREEVFRGPHMEDTWDILFITDEGFVATPFPGREIFSKDKAVKGKGIEGTHSIMAMFMAYGTDMAEGKMIQNINLTDIAPTILHMFGTPIPEDMDGRVLKEIFREDSELAGREVRYRRRDRRERIQDIVDGIEL